MLPRTIPSALGLLLSALLPLASAQTSTDCQPLNTTDCPADPAFGTDYTFYFNATPNADAWETTAGSVSYDPDKGATFTINKQGDSPTIRTKFYYFFGRTEVIMKTAPGTGIISSIMGLSDDLDEIDWEFLGGNGTHAEANYFGKGRQDYMNAIYYPVHNGTQADYHNYTTVWTNTSLQYWIDGGLVRTLLPENANDTENYPQTPMRLSIGIWAGGDPTLPEGTRSWAGGDTDYSKGPFSFYVKSVRITDYTTNATSYTYGDMTGTASSIKVATGNSTVLDSLNTNGATATSSSSSSTSLTDSISNKWSGLSPVAKIAIGASAGGVAAALAGFFLFYFLRQRARGAREARLAEAHQNEERMELARYKAAGIDPDGLVAQSEYDAQEMRREGVTGSNGYSIPNTPVDGHGEREKWAAAAAVGAGAAGTMPLLRDRADSGPLGQHPQSPPHALNTNLPYSDHNHHMGSPVQSMGSPVSPVQQFNATQGGMRSFSSPNPPMRVGTPGNGGYGDLQRMGSPGLMMQQPAPQRSFTANGPMHPYEQAPSGAGQNPFEQAPGQNPFGDHEHHG